MNKSKTVIEPPLATTKSKNAIAVEQTTRMFSDAVDQTLSSIFQGPKRRAPNLLKQQTFDEQIYEQFNKTMDTMLQKKTPQNSSPAAVERGDQSRCNSVSFKDDLPARSPPVSPIIMAGGIFSGSGRQTATEMSDHSNLNAKMRKLQVSSPTFEDANLSSFRMKMTPMSRS